MSRREAERAAETPGFAATSDERSPADLLGDPRQLIAHEIPHGLNRRGFLMRTAVGGAAAVLTGCGGSPEEAKAKAVATTPATPAAAPSAPPLASDLDVVMRAKGPVLTTVDEFYKVGPGPSSSHTIGPMRITYDFYHRGTKLPAYKIELSF
jgi:L-serine dehydratase